MKNFKKGFTLIELLVVIAIISLLTSVALASLGQARARAADANIKSTLNSIKTEAEIYYSNNNNFGAPATSCTTSGSLFVNPKITALINAAQASSGANATCVALEGDGFEECPIGGCPPSSGALNWRIYIPLKAEGANTYWCVDSTGASKSFFL
jgi:prepilin-type N-terminal cleavage/methylation domain-containing protein